MNMKLSILIVQLNLSSNTFTIRYEDTQKNAMPQIPYDGIPFMIRGRKTMECHQGKDRNVAKKMKAKQIREQKTDHDFTRHRHLVQNTKKRDCPAMIKIRHFIKFTDYKVMNAYMSLKCRERKDLNVYFLTCEIITSIFCGLFDPDDPFPIHAYLRDVDIEEYDIMIGALNEAGCHWSLMVIKPKELQLLYLNPMGESREMKDIYLQKWLQFLDERVIKGFGASISNRWTISSKRHNKQLDSNSCGVYVLKFADLELKGVEDFRFNNTKKGLKALRMSIGQCLVESSDNMKEAAITQEIFDDQVYDDTDEYNDESDAAKISMEICRENYQTCKEEIYKIINCQGSKCDLRDHVRHHEFICDPLKVYNRERLTNCFGIDVFTIKAVEFIHESLVNDLLFKERSHPKCPYTKRGILSIVDMKNDDLYSSFKKTRLAHDYVLYVVSKEVLIKIHMSKTDSSYEIANNLCVNSEINLSEKLRNKKKNVNNVQ